MARFSDVPKVIRSVGLYGFLRRVVREMSDDDVLVWSAAMAYSWLFAAFPFMLFLLALLAFLPPDLKLAVSDQAYAMIYDSMAQQAADTIWKNVNELLSNKHTGIISVGLILAIWGASGGMSMTISALDHCYELKPGRPIYRHRIVSVIMTIFVAVLLVSVLLLLPIGTLGIAAVEKWGMDYISRPLLWTWKLARVPLALGALFMIVNLLYHYGPDVRQKFALITPGGVFCVLTWMLLGWCLRLYVERFGNFNQTYGAVGGVIILLLVFYIDAVALLAGAEINSEIDYEVLKVPRGSRDFTGSVHE